MLPAALGFVRGKSGYTPNLVDFDGTNDYLTRGGGLTGAANGTQGTLVFTWKKGSDGNFYMFDTASSGTKPLELRVFATSESFAARLYIGGTQLAATISTWPTLNQQETVLLSWDTNYSAGNKKLHWYVGNTNRSPTITDSNPAFTIDYNTGVTNWIIAAANGGAQKLDGCLGDFWFEDTYLDFSTESNRRKFVDASGNPVSLGADGSTPTGSSPLIYLGNDYSSFATNLGTGGNFSVTGTLAAC